MRKFAVAAGAALFVTVMTALPALADSSIPHPHHDGGVSGAGGTAFTGAAHVGTVMVALVVLVMLGFSALYLQRRTESAR